MFFADIPKGLTNEGENHRFAVITDMVIKRINNALAVLKGLF